MAASRAKSESDWRAMLKRSLMRAGKFVGAGILALLTLFSTVALLDYHESDRSLNTAAGGPVVGWGYDRGFGQTNPPPDLTNAVAIAAGGEQSLALKDDGTVVQWGQMSGPTGLSNGVAIGSSHFHDIAL